MLVPIALVSPSSGKTLAARDTIAVSDRNLTPMKVLSDARMAASGKVISRYLGFKSPLWDQSCNT